LGSVEEALMAPASQQGFNSLPAIWARVTAESRLPFRGRLPLRRPGLGSRPVSVANSIGALSHDLSGNSPPRFFYRVARTTLPCSKVGLSVSHWNCLILGFWRSTSPSRKAGRRRRFGLAGVYRAPISARPSLSARSQEPDSPGTRGERHTFHLLANYPRRTCRLLDLLSLAGPA